MWSRGWGGALETTELGRGWFRTTSVYFEIKSRRTERPARKDGVYALNRRKQLRGSIRSIDLPAKAITSIVK